MRKFTLFILVFAISIPVSWGTDLHVISDPKITFTKSFVVQPGLYSSPPEIAQNTKTGKFLFVWIKGENPSSIQGKILNPQGAPMPGELTLAASNGFFSVTYNPERNEYLLVYDNLFGNPGLSNIFAQRISDTGKLIGTPIKLATDSISVMMSNYSPRVIFNPITNGYTLVWDRQDGLAGQLLNDKAQPSGPVVLIHQFPGSFFPARALQYHPSGEKVVVVYVVGSSLPDSNDYYLATLDPLLKKVKPADHVKINSAPVIRENAFWTASLAFLPDQTGVIYYADNDAIRMRRINLQGKLNGSSVTAFKGPQKNIKMSSPSAVFSTNSKGTMGLLVATEPGFGHGCWAQALNATGLAVGNSVQFPAVGGGLHLIAGKPTDTIYQFADFAFATNRTDSGLLRVLFKVAP